MRKHGLFHIELESNLLIAQFFGAWNAEQTLDYGLYIKEQALPLLSKPWARIVDLSHWEGGGEEVIAPLYDSHKWCSENNCQIVVFVNPPLVPKYMLEKYGDPYGAYQVYDTVVLAKTSVINQLAEL